MFGFAVFVLWVVAVIATGALAANKGRSVGGWVLLAVFIAPACILILAAMPNLRKEAEEERRHQEVIGTGADTRACPHCAESIKKAAKVCKHCGRDVEPDLTPAPAPSGTPTLCPNCAKTLKPTDTKCGRCGKVFSEKEEVPASPMGTRLL